MDLKQFAERLSVSRQNRKMTQEEFASRLGVTPQAVSKWERGMSLPDTSLLADICQILTISADELLQTGYKRTFDKEGIIRQVEVLKKLEITDPLQILLGSKLVEDFQKGFQSEQCQKLRLKLAGEGLLMPTIRVMDVDWIDQDSFLIRAYEKVLYEEKLTQTDETMAGYIWKKLEEVVSDYRNYAYILNRDMVKILIDRAKQMYPILIEETVPERISYRYLHRIMREMLLGGHGISNLNKMIETIDEHMEDNLTPEEMTKLLI